MAAFGCGSTAKKNCYIESIFGKITKSVEKSRLANIG